MPFSKTSERHDDTYWTAVFEKRIRPSVESLGYLCKRSEAVPTNIIKNVIKSLLEADLVIAVLTDKNANVWYELGIRHVLRKGTIMMMEKGQKLPFDISQYGVLFYEDHFGEGGEAFTRELKEKIEYLALGGADNPVGDFLSELSNKKELTKNSFNDYLKINKDQKKEANKDSRLRQKGINILWIEKYSNEKNPVFVSFSEDDIFFTRIADIVELKKSITDDAQFNLIVIVSNKEKDFLLKVDTFFHELGLDIESIALVDRNLFKSIKIPEILFFKNIVASKVDVIKKINSIV